MPDDRIRLLALDGGGVRGLSSLMVLEALMNTIDPKSPPKPCDYFDMIGGTSTGGLIAIMLGRLKMSAKECIDAYTSLFDKVFVKKRHRLTWKLDVQGRFSTTVLEANIKKVIVASGHKENELLKDEDASCRVFVCAKRKEIAKPVCLTSYRTERIKNPQRFEATTIWQACRATSAATSFFDPITIGQFDERFVDGALGENNPIYSLWTQAQDVWGEQMQDKLQCIVSIGTGVLSLGPVRNGALGMLRTLQEISTDTENKAEQFQQDKAHLDRDGRYYRFNVAQGLQKIGLEESKKKTEIAEATLHYVESQDVGNKMKACANRLAGRDSFSLEGVSVSDNFVDRSSYTVELEQWLLPQRLHPREERRRKIFVLHGLGGIGKTQIAANFARKHKAAFDSVFWLDGRSENRLRQSFARCARRIPPGQIPETSQKGVPTNEDNLEKVVTDVLDWLAKPENTNWLLIFDNVDLDSDQGGTTSTYEVKNYLHADHGSVLITTRLAQLSQLGKAKQVKSLDDESLSKAIFDKWYGRELVLDAAGKELLRLLDGLPLALAQAAVFCQETGVDIASYIELYNGQKTDLMASDTTLTDYERSIGTTWTISFKAIEKKNSSAANLLRLWAFFSNRDLWHGLLQIDADDKNIPRESFPEWLLELIDSHSKFLGTVALLRRYSMIEVQESEQASYNLHPVVHRWASHIQDDSLKRAYLQWALLLLGASRPPFEASWEDQRRFLAHTDVCIQWMGKIHGPKWSGEPHMPTSVAMHYLAALYKWQERPSEAAALAQRALQDMEKELGPDDPWTLQVVSLLGSIYFDQDLLPDAEAMFERALQGFEKTLGPNHLSTLNAATGLGSVYQVSDRFADAEIIYKRALHGFEKTLGPDDNWTLSMAAGLGDVYYEQHRLPEAKVQAERAVQGFQKQLGSNHRQTLSCFFLLGKIYFKQGRSTDAEAMLQQMLEGYKNTLGPNHAFTVNMIGWLDDVRREHLEQGLGQGQLPEARAVRNRALQRFFQGC